MECSSSSLSSENASSGMVGFCLIGGLLHVMDSLVSLVDLGPSGPVYMNRSQFLSTRA